MPLHANIHDLLMSTRNVMEISYIPFKKFTNQNNNTFHQSARCTNLFWHECPAMNSIFCNKSLSNSKC